MFGYSRKKGQNTFSSFIYQTIPKYTQTYPTIPKQRGILWYNKPLCASLRSAHRTAGPVYVRFCEFARSSLRKKNGATPTLYQLYHYTLYTLPTLPTLPLQYFTLLYHTLPHDTPLYPSIPHFTISLYQTIPHFTISLFQTIPHFTIFP